MKYDAILFDLDGVLVTGRETTPGVYRSATERLIRAFGGDGSSEWTQALENPSSGAEFREACQRWEFQPDSAWGYRERTATGLEGRRIRNRKRAPFGDVDVLEELAAKYRIGICSNNRHPTVADCLEEFGWCEYIDIFRGRFPTLTDFDRRKPDPTYLGWVIERIDAVDPLFIGDRLSDVQTAEQVGCDAALLTRDGDVPTGTPTPTYHIQSLFDLRSLDQS